MNSTERFSDRVENYVRYRPGYPEGIIQTLVSQTGLSPGAVVADIGSGTGISAELFLRHGCTVHGVEPNEAMRAAAERPLSGYPHFHSIDGTAEATTLRSGSIDHVVAAQAFHWFDAPAARREFTRILKPGGWVVLFWNTRLTDASLFLRAYEDLLLEYATDYSQIDHRNVDAERLQAFFGGGYEERSFENHQQFDLEGLCGRLLSSSYAPNVGHPRHAPMLEALQRIFHAHQQDGRVRFEYRTEMHFGLLTDRSL
jgi:SAM-dependent methyltransferase